MALSIRQKPERSSKKERSKGFILNANIGTRSDERCTMAKRKTTEDGVEKVAKKHKKDKSVDKKSKKESKAASEPTTFSLLADDKSINPALSSLFAAEVRATRNM